MLDVLVDSVGLTVAGIVGCWGLFGVAPHCAPTPSEVSFTRFEFAEQFILVPMLAFQLWDFVVTLIFADLRDWAMVLHHVAVAIISWVCTEYAFCQRTLVFFMGVVEITNVPLTVYR